MTKPQRHGIRLLVVAFIIGIVGMVASVALVGVKTASNIKDSESKARRTEAHRVQVAREASVDDLRAGCARSVARDFEALSVNDDLKDLAGTLKKFAGDAAEARRGDGNEAKAREYEESARRADSVRRAADQRVDSVKIRLPTSQKPSVVAKYCRERFPSGLQ